MRLKSRRKSSRFRGSKTHARGFKKKARGSGHRGGFGLAGTGKRGKAKKTMVLNLFGNDYLGKDKALRRGNLPNDVKVINLQYIQDNLHSLIKQGKAKESSKGIELDFSDYKILGEGECKQKLHIKAHSASQSAIEKVKKAGGEISVKFGSEAKEAKK